MEELHDFLVSSLKFAEETADRELQGRLRNQFGIHYCSIGKYEKAIENLKVYQTIAKEIGDKKGEGRACGNLGACYSYLGQYDKAIKYLKTFLTIAKDNGDMTSERAAYSNLGKCYSSLGQYDKAIENQESSLTIAKEIGDKKGEGVAYGNLGDCYSNLRQYGKAINYQKMCLTTANEIGDKNGEGTAYGNLGICYTYLGQYDQAIEYQETSLIIAKEIGDKKGEGKAYGNLAKNYNVLCQYDEAIKNLELFLTIAKETGDKKGEGIAYGNLGNCYISVNQYDKAINYLKMCLTIAKEIGDKKNEGVAYGKLGTCYICLSQYDKAINYLRMLLTIAKENRDKKGEEAANCNLGICYIYLGRYDKAIEYQEISLTIAKELGDKKGIESAYGKIGSCYCHLGQYGKAVNYLEMSLMIAKAIGDKEGEGAAYSNLGSCYIFLGQFEKAFHYLEMHLTIAKVIGDKTVKVAVYGTLGTCYICLSQYNKAIKYIKIALTIAKEMGQKRGEGTAYENLGTCYSFIQNYDKAESNLRKGVECYEELFERNVPKWDEDKVSVRDKFMCFYEELIEILLAQEKMDEALIIAERGRSRALADLMLTTYPVNYALVAEVKVSDLQGVRKVVKTLGRTVIFFSSLMPDICTWIIQPDGDIMFQRRRAEVSQQSREYCEKNDSSHSAEDLNSLVNKAIELMTSCGVVRCEDRSLSFLYPEEVSKPITRKRVLIRAGAAKLLKVPHSAAPMKDYKTSRPTAAVHQGQTETSNNPEASTLNFLLKDLYKILLHPVRKYVVGSQAIVVPEGALALVPFSALLDENGNYTAESFQVRIIPSLATAKMIRERPEEPAGRASRPLVVGDPDIGQVKKGKEIIIVPRLEFAKKEVEEVVGPFLEVKPLVGENATKKRFLKKVESANLIHIAAHGDAERGEILLAPPQRTNISDLEDVMLMISDLEGKRIKAKLVVLSCCYSGRGEVRGEGVVGIARAFLGAGARAVLVTLWAVDDGATLCFMYRFYEYLTSGDSASEALKKAIQATRKLEKFGHPRYWTPFVLLGEDVAPFVRS